MARVISWIIDGKYVYIEKQGSSYIRDTKLSNEETKQLGTRVTSWEESTYSANFSAMRNEVVGRWGSSVDMESDYRYYFNATGEEGVYMLTGIDGANTADYGKPFYNLAIENNNTSLGLGGNYTLDKAAVLYTTIFLERNGSIYVPERVSAECEGNIINGVTTQTVEENKTKVGIPLSAGTTFNSSEHVKEIIITAEKDGYVGKVVFSVVGVKDGEEGVSYDLLVYPRVIKVTADGIVGNHYVKCRALKNGEDVSSEPSIKIKYDFGVPTIDADDLTREYDTEGSGINYEEIAQGGDQVNFYLLFNNKIVDSDSCYISRDGQSGGYVKLELGNEMDGISVGNDSDLDLDGGEVTVGTGFILYSGGTELILTGEVMVDGMDAAHSHYKLQSPDGAICDEDYRSGEKITCNAISGYDRANIFFTFEDQFDFGEDHKDSIKITVWGRNSHGVVTSATATYTVMAISGGKDGEVYKIVPNMDVIMCDPNEEPPYSGEQNLTAKAFIGLEEIQNPEITYSIDVMYGDPSNTTGMAPDGIPVQGLINNDNSYVVLYLWTGGTQPESKILVDRETIPIIWQGANGNSVWVELGNEIDAVSVGNDSDLDLGESLSSVAIGTSVRIMSGGTPVQISDIQVIPPAVNDSWNDRSKVDWSSSLSEDNTLGEVSITLFNGFEFGADYREEVTISVTAATGDNWTGFARYIIKGVKGGKDGYVYRLVPEVDYVYFHPNEGNNGTIDDGQNHLTCEAYYGSIKLGSNEAGSDFGKIYYSINKVCTSTTDTTSSGYVTGMTQYDGGVHLNNLINKNNYTNFKYVVFYLVSNDGEIIDRETVPIVADGLDGSDNVTIELTNEIDTIGVGSDFDLDLDDGQSVTASTGVKMFSGATELTITNVTGVFSINTNATKDTYNMEWVPETQEFQVILRSGFNFGSDLKEKVILTVQGKNIAEENATGYATFVISGIKGGKDGAVYKIWPTPDYVYYDLQTSSWGSNTNGVRAWAFLNGKKMSEQGLKEGEDYQIKTTQGFVTDIDNASEMWTNATFMPYTEGSQYQFSAPSDANSREQSIVFYLALKSKESSKWVVVDRESVGLFINGKEGKDGEGSIVFDLSNENWVVTTGNDTKLDIASSAGITGGTYISCSSGNTYAAINIATGSTAAGVPSSNCEVEIQDNGQIRPFLKVTLRNGFDFGSSQRKEITITGTTLLDGFSGVTTFGLVCVKNGKEGKEGVSYMIKSNAGSILYDSVNDRYLPNSLKVWLYEGATDITRTHKFTYEVLDTDGTKIMGPTTVNGSSVSNNGLIADISGTTNGLRIGKISVTASTTGGAYRDSADFPIIPSGKDGSGVVVDLTNDRDTIGIGSNLVLEAEGGFTFGPTIATVWDGSTQLKITGGNVEIPNIQQSSKITYSGEVINDNQYEVSIHLADGFSFSSNDGVEGKQIAFYINVTAETTDNDTKVEIPKTAKYTIHGFEGAEDGRVFRIIPSYSSVKVIRSSTPGAPDSYIPAILSAVTTVNGEPNYDIYMEYRFDGDDPEAIHGGEYKENDETERNLKISDLVSKGLNQWITFFAYDKQGGTLLDKETVFLLRDGVDGEGGLELKISPESLYIRVDSDKRPIVSVTATTTVSMYTGSSDASISALTIGGTLPEGWGVSSGRSGADNVWSVSFGIPRSYTFPDTGMIQFPITAQYGSSASAKRTVTFTIYSDNRIATSERGALTRLRNWAVNDEYESGGAGNKYWDFVYNEVDGTGKYYGCKANNTGNAGNEPGVGPNWENFWDEYEGNIFTASQVGFFGEGIDGWVINRDFIEHTSHSIKMAHDGSIQFRNKQVNYYEYKSDSGKIYAKEAFAISNKPSNGTAVEVAVGSPDGIVNASEYTFKWSGSAPTIEKKIQYKRSGLYFDGLGIYPQGNLTEAVSFDVDATLYEEYTSVTSYLLYSIKYNTEESCPSDFVTDRPTQSPEQPIGFTYSQTATCCVIYEYGIRIFKTKVSAGQTNGTTESGSSYYKQVKEETMTFSGVSGDSPVYISVSGESEGETAKRLYSEILKNLGSSTHDVSGIWSSIVMGKEGSEYGNVLLGAVSVQGDYTQLVQKDITIPNVSNRTTVCAIDLSGRTNAPFSADTKVKTVGSESVYIDTEKTRGQIKGVDFDNYFDSCKGVGKPDTTEVYRAVTPTEPYTSITPLFAEINPIPDNTQSDRFGKMFLSSGIKGNGESNTITLVRWVNVKEPDDVLFSTTNFATNSYGDIVICYTYGESRNSETSVGNTPMPISLKKIQYGNSSGYALQTYSDSVYAEDTTVSGLYASNFGATRIYEDGTIITNALYAMDGYFSGSADINDGRFNGSVNITGGTIDSVKITNSKINGSLTIDKGGVFEMLDPTGYQVVEISSQDLDPNGFGNHTYAIPSLYKYDSNSNNFGRKSGIFSGSIITVNVSSGADVTVPSLNLNLSFNRKIVKANVNVYVSIPGNNRVTAISTSATGTSSSANRASSQINQTAKSAGEIEISYICTYELTSKSLGSTPSIKLTISSNGSISVKNTSSGARHYVIANNGFSFNDGNGSEVSMIKNGYGYSTIHLKVGTQQRYNQIHMDQNTFQLTAVSGNTSLTKDVYKILEAIN